MRVVNDKRYAKHAIGVDLILGGHDHIYWLEQRWDQLVVKSSCDYRCFNEIKIEKQDNEIYQKKTKKSNQEVNDDTVVAEKEYLYKIPNQNKDNDGQYEVKIYKRDITEEVEPHPEIAEFVKSYDEKWDAKMKGILCRIVKPLNVKFSHVRTEESTIGNFLSDLMRKETQSDVAILNSGGIRADSVYQPGFLSIGDWCAIFPYRGGMSKQEITGEQLHIILESAIGKFPELEGRWPSVSNISFEFDSSAPPGSRIAKDTIRIDHGNLNYEQKYSVACSRYIALGNDGYELFKESKPLLDEDSSPFMNDVIQQVFDYPKHEKYVKEFNLFKAKGDEISPEFFSVMVKEELHYRDSMFLQTGDYAFDYPEGMSDSSDDEDSTTAKENKNDFGNTLGLLRELSLVRRESSGKTSVELGRLPDPALDTRGSFSQSDPSLTQGGKLTGMLTEENIDQVIEGQVKLSKDCCIRLRMYKLFESIEMGPDGENIFVYNPDVQGRINCVGNV